MEDPRMTLVDKPTDDLLIRVPDKLPLLDVDVVEGTCIDVRQELYRQFNQEKLILTFSVYEPFEWEGTRLELFVTLHKKPGPRSKLSPIAQYGRSRSKTQK